MKGRYREVYRNHEIVVTRPSDSRRWSWLDHRAGEGFGFDTRWDALRFARERIDRYASNTVAFIWSIEHQRYLGISVESNRTGEFCNAIRAHLCAYNAPHAFSTEAEAKRALAEEAPWYNSGPSWPMRGSFNLDNCKVIEVELDPSPIIGMEIQQ